MSSTAEIYRTEAEAEPLEELQQPLSLAALIRRHPRVLVASGLLAVLIIAAVVAPWISPHDPIAASPDDNLLPPGPGHWLGTDELGRDVLSRVIYGGRVSLPVAVVAVGFGVLTGGLIGITAGYRGRATDLVLMRFIDAILAFPAIVLAISIAAALGPSLRNAMIAIGVVQVPIYARLARAQVLQVKQFDFVSAARALGAAWPRIIFRHLLPNLLNPIIVQMSLSAAFAILAEATLSFLGLSAQPPAADWGFMIFTGAHFLTNNDWWLAVAPGIAICLAVFGFNWLGDALRDALDPRLRQ